MPARRCSAPTMHPLLAVLLLLVVVAKTPVLASRGDDLLEFKACVQSCIKTNCPPQSFPSPSAPQDPPTSPPPLAPVVPLHRRLLLWTCPAECDYACQRSVTQERVRVGLPVEQFHGKWPFRRLLGVQEPFSVLFSLLNGYAHYRGLRSLRRELPRHYTLRPYYHAFAYIGLFCWFWSAVFHARDFLFTERMDYFSAGANVLYSLYYSPIRIFRLYRPQFRARLRLWGYLCLAAYLAHVSFLLFVRWDYTYNMAANVAVGTASNLLWTYFSIVRYRKLKRFWAAWPGLVVAWLVMAMSFELLDFPPLADALDAHALWHAMTILPTVWWYRFLIRDARQNIEHDEDIVLRAKA